MANFVLKWLFTRSVVLMGAQHLHRSVSNVRRKELKNELIAALGTKVLAGPFKDMILPMKSSWGTGDYLSKLIGTYEEDLRNTILNAVSRKPQMVINVGCAEGYYAVGLARLLPDAVIYAFDLDKRACAVCAQAAGENGVAKRVKIEGACTTERLKEVTTLSDKVLVVMDCEGAEMDLLDPIKISTLVRCDILVETHDFAVPNVLETLKRRFKETHTIETVVQAGRNPNEVPELEQFIESDRWLMVDENRPAIMNWLVCWAK